MHPNVLIVVLDTARRDSFEPYGAARGSTPALAQLAGAGQALEDMYASASWTLPSHASMFTGLPSRALGLGQAPGGRREGCRPIFEAQRGRLLPEVLRRAGYATAAVSANVWIAPETGFDIGFDRFESVSTERIAHMQRGDARARVSWALEAARSRVDDGAAAAARVLASMIDGRPQRPFFWFVNLVECHSPYLPPRPYNDLSLADRLRAAEEARRHLDLHGIWRACAGGFDIPTAAIERMRRLYASAVRYMDDWLARVLERLDAAALLDDTLVIATSDHGENLGEGNLIGHAFSLDERLIRVPLVTRGPARLAQERLPSLLDLPRLVAGAVGLEDHPWRERLAEPGVAVAQFDELAGPGDARIRQVADEWDVGEEGLRRMTTPITCATDGRRKIVRFGDEELAYDLVEDPLELDGTPAASVNGDFAHLRAALEEPRVWTRPAGITAGAPAGADSADIERRMRLLGYM